MGYMHLTKAYSSPKNLIQNLLELTKIQLFWFNSTFFWLYKGTAGITLEKCILERSFSSHYLRTLAKNAGRFHVTCVPWVFELFMVFSPVLGIFLRFSRFGMRNKGCKTCRGGMYEWQWAHTVSRMSMWQFLV